MNSNNKTAIVTGAGSGIGKAAAILLVAEGWQVFAVDRDEAGLQELQQHTGSTALITFGADLRKPADIKNYSAFVLDRFGHVDAALLNAGICGTNTNLEDYPETVFDEVMAVNLKAIWLGMRALVPSMKERRRGSIVLTSSIQGLSALPGTTAYTTSKHALVGMMKGAALELAPFNVRVNTVHPGYVATPMMDSIHRAVMPDAPEEFETTIARTIPMQRYARAEEIAQLLLFLASDRSSYSTGNCFTADGGLLAALP